MRCKAHVVGAMCPVPHTVVSPCTPLCRAYSASIDKVEIDFVSARGFLSRPQEGGGGGRGWRAAAGAFDYRDFACVKQS